MSDAPSKTRGGRRPGAGRPPTGAAKLIVQERVAPELAAHCKAAQATTPGYLARLIEKDLRQVMNEDQRIASGEVPVELCRDNGNNAPTVQEYWFEPSEEAALAACKEKRPNGFFVRKVDLSQ